MIESDEQNQKVQNVSIDEQKIEQKLDVADKHECPDHEQKMATIDEQNVDVTKMNEIEKIDHKETIPAKQNVKEPNKTDEQNDYEPNDEQKLISSIPIDEQKIDEQKVDTAYEQNVKVAEPLEQNEIDQNKEDQDEVGPDEQKENEQKMDQLDEQNESHIPIEQNVEQLESTEQNVEGEQSTKNWLWNWLSWKNIDKKNESTAELRITQKSGLNFIEPSVAELSGSVLRVAKWGQGWGGFTTSLPSYHKENNFCQTNECE